MSMYGIQNFRNNPAISAWKSSIQAQNAKVIAHEEAHRSGAGPQAIGSPVYSKQTVTFGGQSQEVIAGGHQGVAVPGPVSPKAPEGQIKSTITAAENAEKGALAPSDELSDADKSVANSAKAVKAQANNALSQKNNQRKPLNVMA